MTQDLEGIVNNKPRILTHPVGHNGGYRRRLSPNQRPPGLLSRICLAIRKRSSPVAIHNHADIHPQPSPSRDPFQHWLASPSLWTSANQFPPFTSFGPVPLPTRPESPSISGKGIPGLRSTGSGDLPAGIARYTDKVYSARQVRFSGPEWSPWSRLGEKGTTRNGPADVGRPGRGE
ncbi:hypothetical protein ASPZODRAFT_1839344 [Penicilliopsis zonata CBS 506.65]|uniref:Uncharacterized protein n=1 Tax=Penicilliopsis zonata CBS 506.65 TaxID=1073090 RepID=A0A1L9SI15_9EURO|nr:hypothetical protein ASPZODRAFT_1839344 [Penicilliopsis zonata CBS 506.65]OJJ46862.1 hypothetical protein ASPZODRAFT_1839344 [Penicilliopsis zonata CBS 506.65]